MSKRILIIDDDSEVLDAFVLALGQSGFDVETASSGEEGVEKFRFQPCDLIFLDLKMEGIDGVETLYKIREQDPDVPVYIVTAYHALYSDKLLKAKDQGLDFSVLEKPMRQEDILTLARQILTEGAERN